MVYLTVLNKQMSRKRKSGQIASAYVLLRDSSLEWSECELEGSNCHDGTDDLWVVGGGLSALMSSLRRTLTSFGRQQTQRVIFGMHRQGHKGNLEGSKWSAIDVAPSAPALLPISAHIDVGVYPVLFILLCTSSGAQLLNPKWLLAQCLSQVMSAQL